MVEELELESCGLLDGYLDSAGRGPCRGRQIVKCSGASDGARAMTRGQGT